MASVAISVEREVKLTLYGCNCHMECVENILCIFLIKINVPIHKIPNWTDGPFGNIYINLLLLPFQWKGK